jgi:flagellar hook-length control protein FliK
MLSLLTSASPPKAATGAAPEAAVPGGRRDGSPGAVDSFARALQHSSAALQQADTPGGRANAADPSDATDRAAPRSTRRGTDRLRPHGMAGAPPTGLDPSKPDTGRTAAKAARTSLPEGIDDDRDPAEPTAATAAAGASAAGFLPTVDAAAVATLTAPTVATTDCPLHDPATTGAGSPAAACSSGAAAALQVDPSSDGRSMAVAASDAPPSALSGRPGSSRANPESAAGADPSTTGAEASDATAAMSRAGPSAAEGSLPDTSAAAMTGTGSPSLLSDAATIPMPAAVASTAQGTAAAVLARADASRRPSAVRATTAPEARGTVGDGRRPAGRADAVSDPSSSGASALSALPASGTAAEPRATRQTAAGAGRPGAPDSATERAGHEGGGAAVSSASSSAAPSANAAIPRFAEQLQAMMPAAAAAGANAHDGGNAPATAHAQLAAPLTSPEFPPALGAQVSLFARNGVERATIEINPPEMGPISVQIALDGSGARIDFLADVAATRQVIEAALPSLASSLREAGLTLTGGGVFQQPQSSAHFAGQGSGQPGHGQGQGQDGRPGTSGDDAMLAGGTATVLRTGAHRGLVDLVA